MPLVSDACTDVCRHGENALVHRVGDVDALERHITMLDEDRALLRRLREACLEAGPSFTWTAAGRVLHDVYRDVIAASAEAGERPPERAVPVGAGPPTR